MSWKIDEIYPNNEACIKECHDTLKKMKCFYITYKRIEVYTIKLLVNTIHRYEDITNLVLKAQLYKTLVYYGQSTEMIDIELDNLIDGYNLYVIGFPISLVQHSEVRKMLENALLGQYCKFLSNVLDESKYLLGEESEKIIRLKNLTGYNAMQQLYLSILEEASFYISGIGKVNYNCLLGLLNCNDEKIRRSAAKKLGSFFISNNGIFTQIFNYTTQDLLIDKKIRGYHSIYDNIYRENELNEKCLELLESYVTERRTLFQRYYKIKARKQGKEHIEGISYLNDVSTNISLEEAVNLIKSTFAKLSPEYEKIVNDIFEMEHVDYECRERKQSGSICFAAVPDIKPYIFINYNGTINDLFMLAHELGHAIQFVVSSKKNSIVNYVPSNLHAESIAIFFETLVCEELLKRGNNSDDLLMEVADNLVGKIFRQTLNYMFEERARKFEGYISAEEIEKIWIELREYYYGNTVKFFQYEKNNYWSIPHFICEPMLTSIYSFSQVIAIELLDKRNENNFITKFMKYLELKSNDSFMDYLKEAFDIEIGREKDWDNVFAAVNDLISRLETCSNNG